MMKININHLTIGKIFLNNLEKDLFVREIERLTKIDIKSLNRYLKDLLNYNILDYTMVGKTKVYILKNTFETKIFLELVEKYKALEFIKNHRKLKLYLEKLNSNCKFLIFGSYANNTFNNKSDLDIVIFSKKTKEVKNLLNSFPIHIHSQFINNFEDFKKTFNKKTSLSIEIIKNHISFGNVGDIINLTLKWKNIN